MSSGDSSRTGFGSCPHKFKADDTGDCNVGEEERQASTVLKVYWPYKKGPAPTGVIDGKPVPRVFQRSATFGWNDQIVNKHLGATLPFSATVNDYDEPESNLMSGGASSEQVLWDEPLVNDVPGPIDVFWGSNTGIVVGNPVSLQVPLGGLTSPVTWIVELASLDDQASPEMADDPPVPDVDSAEYKVYRDQLGRDIANEADLESTASGPAVNPGSCHDAATHAYKGTLGITMPPWTNGSSVVVWEAPSNPSLSPSTDLTNTYPFQRGGVVVYNGGAHTQTCKGSGLGVWEFNGRARNPHTWGHSDIAFSRDLLIDPYNPTNDFPNVANPNVLRFTVKTVYYPPPS